jgi:hypothetical protein
MPGERDLKALLQSMKPKLKDGIFVFCTFPRDAGIPSHLDPILLFREEEGLTFVVRIEDAQKANLPFEFPSRMITLMVHSSLNAVGFMAAITSCLGKAGISVNPVSAFYHDHLFVPMDRADEVISLLENLATHGPVRAGWAATRAK